MTAIESSFREFPVLKTDRLRLRCLRPEDDQAIFAYKSANERQFPRIERHGDIAESKRFIADCIEARSKNAGFYWGITFPEDDTVIGTVGLCAMHGDPIIEYRAEISCALSPGHRSKGIMREARIAVINYAFVSWPCLQRIHSEIAFENEPSRRMNLDLGFKEEGTLRSYQRGNDRRFWDIRVLSLLRADWNENITYASKDTRKKEYYKVEAPPWNFSEC
jgi:ribosomal-protein-alanine N-acetyltransferase